ncbi:ketoacyl-synt-domain-containing protein [Thozetella sp. PMI_491]|nr:ketoacyl-synt-domain-containing protein [Thozetella sp. PMI_491]
MTYKQPLLEPVAIVGSSCRFGGGANSPAKLWDLLKSPLDLSQPIPSTRFNIDSFYHADGEHHGTTNSPKAYFLDQNHKVFDASFFNISPKEAEAIDPQQRMLLEVVYEALESAGYSLQEVAGNSVAVFSGLMTQDYDGLSQKDDLAASNYFATGNARSLVSNRISYFFDFRGPSMTIDTACSSSLVSLHQAIHSLRAGECEMACVTGVNLLLTPTMFQAESALHMLSSSGHCRMWDADADGYARGEGVAAIFIKRLSAALAAGDRIEAVVRETGTNADGRTPGITMPSSEAQSTLIRNTYRRTGLDPTAWQDRCQYFEAHGTGTQAGDPKEASAVSAAFFGDLNVNSATADESKFLLVGSVKTVIGHTEGAAGLAGILKLVHSMKAGLVPPNLHFNRLNPSIEPWYRHLRVPTELMPWPEVPQGQPKRASLNSFGFGGANAHAIIEQYQPSIHDKVAATFDNKPITTAMDWPRDSGNGPLTIPLVLSATSHKSLAAVARSYRDYLVQHPDTNYDEFAWQAYAHRSALPYRVTATSTDIPGLIMKLETLAGQGKTVSASLGTRARSTEYQPKIMGVFTGQGAQWATMSRGLMKSSTIYAKTIRSLDTVLQSCASPPKWTLEEQIYAEPGVSQIEAAAVSQPLCTALQLSLVDLLRSLGVSFHIVVGHSSGEIAAAYAAGFLTARDAILISYYRGLCATLASGADGEKGGMLAAGLTWDEAETLCKSPEYGGRIAVAAHNAPASVTLSGDLAVLEQALGELEGTGKFSRMLKVDTAYHSPHMTRAGGQYEEYLSGCNISPMRTGNGTAWVSSVSSVKCPTWEELQGQYWRENMEQPVLFYDAVKTVLRGNHGFDCVLEVGPHPALKGPTSQTAKEAGIDLAYISALHRGQGDHIAFSNFLGWMWEHFGCFCGQIGQFVATSRRPGISMSRLDDIPTYPWDHSQEYWRGGRIARQTQHRQASPHELLGFRTPDDNEFEYRWRNILKYRNLPWLSGHVFQEQALFPASAYTIMALDAARAILGGRSATLIDIEDAEFITGLVIDDDHYGVEVLSSLAVTSRGQLGIEATFTVASVPADGRSDMNKNYSATIRIVLGDPKEDVLPPRPEFEAEALGVEPDRFYNMMAETGLVYSGPFRSLEAMRRRLNFASGRVQIRHSSDTTMLDVSPAMLDSCLHLCFLALSCPGDKALWTSFLPRSCRLVRFNMAMFDQHEDSVGTYLVDSYITDNKQPTQESGARFISETNIFNNKGQMQIQVEGLTVTALSSTKAEKDYELYWRVAYDLDPEHAIVEYDPSLYSTDLLLAESCDRVVSYFMNRPLQDDAKWYPWADETEESLSRFIRTSAYAPILERIWTIGQMESPNLLSSTLPSLQAEAQRLVRLQGHLSRVVRQISHRYSRMTVLGVTDPIWGLTRCIIQSLNPSFLSYTVGGTPERHLEAGLAAFGLPLHKHIIQRLDFESNSKMSEFEGQPETKYHLVILSVTACAGADVSVVLSTVNRLLRPGGFLIILSDSEDSTPPLIGLPNDWQQAIGNGEWYSGFAHSHQNLGSGFSLTIRQSQSAAKQRLQLRETQRHGPTMKKLLIIGGSTSPVQSLRSGISQQLLSRYDEIKIAETIGDLDPAEANNITAALLLSDLDGPFISTMNEQRIQSLKALLRPKMVILWVTHNARTQNPECAASCGFTRSVRGEIPGLTLQLLDIETGNAVLSSINDSIISDAFLRLVAHSAMLDSGEHLDDLPSLEFEIYMKEGEAYLPRILPWSPANNRANADRRFMSESVSSLDKIVEIVAIEEADGSFQHETRLDEIKTDIEGAIQVDYSSAGFSKIGPYACIGRFPRLTLRGARALFPITGAHLYNFLPESHPLTSLLQETPPKSSQYSSPSDFRFYRPELGTAPSSDMVDRWHTAIQMALAKATDVKTTGSSVMSYVFVGLTRDLGQSLCRLFVEQGARHIVLASRSPPESPLWLQELQEAGVQMVLEKMDVTDYEAVAAFKLRIGKTMPPVGGVINGAMVLDDRVFSQMSLETLHRVLRPKTIGSRNLDQVFCGPDMEFFIMTSSFAAIGGHSGQANYAAANMYMNGLAGWRRARGLAASSLNIGVIYGLGFLAREKNQLYQGLERDGYPPISERDVHHMFLEAIVAGRPVAGQVEDITSGLKRFRHDDPNPLAWQVDPRFAHLVLPDEESADVEQEAGKGEESLKELVNTAQTSESLMDILLCAIKKHLGRMLQIPEEDVDNERSLPEIGVDSLAAVEIRSWVWKTVGKDVGVMKILAAASIASLCQEISQAVLPVD